MTKEKISVIEKDVKLLQDTFDKLEEKRMKMILVIKKELKWNTILMKLI